MISLEPIGVDVALLRRAFGAFPSGVIAMSALHDGAPAGMAVSSFTSVSLQPPLISVCVQNSSATWPRLRGSRRLGISVLAEEQDQACRALSSKDGDRFTGVTWSASGDEAVFVVGAAALYDCSIHEELPAGDHTIVLLRVHRLATAPDTAPLVFHGSRFRRLDDSGELVSR
ncbi:flavin reductase family protein [Sciscionella sediminilitoris]|uniref:flavin reductase family protein n=1 Tax=Sciscionella sediminilitoris TaxID=1445613 RepID=UPI0004DF09CE|nr:flavin reductase family protein [Sciscionella sp. SE31]